MNWKSRPKLVYFMRATNGSGPIKIGCSCFTEKRLASLSLWSPTPLAIIASGPGSHQLERFLHRKFAGSRSHGEWFHPTFELLRGIDRVKAGSVSVADAFNAVPDPLDAKSSCPRYIELEQETAA